jgi:hypothetical protein
MLGTNTGKALKKEMRFPQGLHSPPMVQRNYACDRWIYSFFRLINLNETGAPAMQRQLYFCLFGQALYLKAQIEGWRSGNIWGMLIWQFNEVTRLDSFTRSFQYWTTSQMQLALDEHIQYTTLLQLTRNDWLSHRCGRPADGARSSTARPSQAKSVAADGSLCNISLRTARSRTSPHLAVPRRSSRSLGE